MPLTRRQREIFDYIAQHIDAKGYAPSFEEIARQFSFQSLATVHEHLTNLERKGFIRRNHNESRAIEVVPPKGQSGATDLPLLGLVAAGEPIEAISGDDSLAVPDELVPRRGRSYVLKVRDQHTFAFSGTYLEVTPPSRLVYTQVFEPTAGGAAPDEYADRRLHEARDDTCLNSPR